MYIAEVIRSVFNTKDTNIELIPLKQGMTNDSFIFSINNERYIIRVPGVNTEKIINRHQEYDVYQAIKDEEFVEPVIYIDRDKGYKISKFIENSHTVNPKDWNEISACLKRLRDFHSQSHRVEHCFDVYLIDFEYAAMQDPDLDLAMFIVYSLFNRQEIDQIIDIYFEHQVTPLKRYKIYSYIAMVGLLWSNWCEAKQDQDLLNSSYAKQQYNYAKMFYQIVFDEARNISEFGELVNHHG